MRIIGRRFEKSELEQCDKSRKSELVCVYGRRRVGKTFLIEQTFGTCFAFRATGVENGNTRQQLKSFNQRLIEHGDETKSIPKDWFEAFSRLDTILSKDDVVLSPNGKKVVFFDEFPWFATPRSDFLMAFGEFWNRRGTVDGNYLFIICGSATSWIIKNVLDDTGTLYHRVTAQIFLTPFSLKETEEFFDDAKFEWSREQIAEFQMVFGGLPFFMDLMNGDESFRQNVDRLIFRPAALLKNESNRLLEATLSKSPVFAQILELLSHHMYGMKKTDCQQELGIADGTFSRAIEDLIRCGYVVGRKQKHEKGMPCYIQLIDPFLLFHYHFLSKNDNISSYEELVSKTGVYTNWRGHAFEVLCLQHIDQIKSALGISGVKTVQYPWISSKTGKEGQIDIVIERDDKITNICEMKCTEQPFSMSKTEEQKLIKNKDIFQEMTGTKQTLRIVLVSAAGVAGTSHMEHISKVITLDDLFE